MNDKPMKYKDLEVKCECGRKIKVAYPIPALSEYHDDMYISQEMEYQERKQLQSNWNSLRECIIGVIEGAREELNTIIHTTDINTKEGLEYVNQCSKEFDVIRKNLEIVLDKMNELESDDNK